MNIYIYENNLASNFDPISITRAAFDIRVGAQTFLERIEHIFPKDKISLIVREELIEITKERHSQFSVNPSSFEDGLWLLGNVIWTKNDLKVIEYKSKLFYVDNSLVAATLSAQEGQEWMKRGGPIFSDLEIRNKVNTDFTLCRYLWDIIAAIPQTIREDSKKYKKLPIDESTNNLFFINPEDIFIRESNIQPGVLINAEKGPVIIDKNVVIGGQSYIEGPVFIGENSTIKPLTKIISSIIGPNCKIAGELDSTVIQGFTNKAHGGHIGDSFLGEWVNLGAGTINSNLKNNYSKIAVEINGKNISTKSIHIGSFLGDYVNTGIGTLINTGSLFGPGSMVATAGFSPKNIKPFTWLINDDKSSINFKKFIATLEIKKERRGEVLSNSEKLFLKKLHFKYLKVIDE